jgi:hypothetical protein
MILSQLDQGDLEIDTFAQLRISDSDFLTGVRNIIKHKQAQFQPFTVKEVTYKRISMSQTCYTGIFAVA